MNKETYLTEYPKHESMRENVKKDKNRLHFHMMPPTGWMNDPNGFSAYQGKVHLFYQFHPYSEVWGPMHWGHYETEDFIKWRELPVALAPDKAYDEAGCFPAQESGQRKVIFWFTQV